MRRLLAMGLGALCLACAGEVDAGFSSGGPQGFPLDIEGPLLPSGEADHLYQCWLGEGVTVARSPSLGTDSLPRLVTSAGELTYADVVLPDGSHARAIAVRFLAPAQERPSGAPRSDGDRARGAEAHPVEVVVARGSRELDATLRLLRWLLFVTWFATVLTCAGIMAWVVQRGLSPLARLSGQIKRADEEILERTFELPGAPEELEPVVAQLNDFVARIRGAFEREQAFTAHAAHELRTPLAGLRSTLEVSLSRERDGREYQESERECLAITMQLQGLVERLLELARASAAGAEARRDPVELEALVEECWLPLSDAAAERGVYLLPDIPIDLVPQTDRQLLRRVLQNLLENAAVYAEPDSPIELTAAASGARGVRITCVNAARGVALDIGERAFEPFWRADSARAATGVHAGLGLALCKSFVDVLGGRIELLAADGRFTVTVELDDAS